MEGKPLGKGDGGTIDKFSRHLRAARNNPVQGKYFESFAKKLADEGVRINPSYEGPRWKARLPPNHQTHRLDMKQRKRWTRSIKGIET